MNIFLRIKWIVGRIYENSWQKTLFRHTKEERKSLIESFPEPQNQLERSYFQYLCQTKELHVIVRFMQNIAAILLLPWVFFLGYFAKPKKMGDTDAVFLNLNEGYVEQGLIYVGGLYASDANNSSCDLDIALFSYISQTNDICYIIRQGEKIIEYGYLETEAKTLSDKTEYTAIKTTEASTNGKAETYGYVFDDKVENGAGYVITAAGKKVKAKEMSVESAWELQKEAY